MASKVLYPPVLASYMSAFEGGTEPKKIYFRLSKFNSSKDIKSVHATIVAQSNNKSVVNTSKENNKTGIILDLPIYHADNDLDLFYTEILSSDLTQKEWVPDWIYKIQIRLSSVVYATEASKVGQAKWLDAHANDFSEWSTICIVKAINHIYYTIEELGVDTDPNHDDSNNKNIEESENTEKIKTLDTSTLTVSGKFTNCGKENIYLYNFILYDNEDNIVENSGDIYANQFQDNKSYNYTFKTELKDQAIYKLGFKFETMNHFIGGAYKYINDSGAEVDNRYTFQVFQTTIQEIDCYITTAEHDPDKKLKDITSVHEEEEEGRIGLQLSSINGLPYSGNICIRRSDSRTNFTLWDDIKIMVIKGEILDELPIIYDYTIESGVWYKYGVQEIDVDVAGTRSILKETEPVLRNFNYSFLLGENDQQLKLMFDNNMSSFKIQIQDSKVDPIGATYPIVTRNAATRYRTFPINGLISFWMDENELFCNKKVVYDDNKGNHIVDKYNQYNSDNGIIQYDYIYERDFRKVVLDFLHNGKFKLFKSPTEGNIIVRLTDINCVPNQSLDRMIYSFTSNAYEMAEPTMENYLKYNFYKVGERSIDLSFGETKLGQIQMNAQAGVTNILDEIYKKYDSAGKNLGGYSKKILKIHHIKITFDGKPLKFQSVNKNNEVVTIMGNKFSINNKPIMISSPLNMYVFDERLSYLPSESLIIYGDIEEKEKEIPVTVDFLYDLKTSKYQEKQIATRKNKVVIGQLFNSYAPGAGLYREIVSKYYIEAENEFRRLSSISSIEIEANPGVVIGIQDAEDTNIENHIINETGQLRLNDLNIINNIIYVGVKDKNSDTINKKINSDIAVNYCGVVVTGTYKPWG